MIDFQKIHDWYICNIEDLKDFYSRNIHKFWKRGGLVETTSNFESLDDDVIPIGYSEHDIDEKSLNAMRGRHEKASEKY